MSIAPQIKKLLNEYGLGSLTKWASNAIVNGWSEDQIINELYERPEFKNRFPAIDQLKKKKRPPVSVQEYLAYEKMVSHLASMWGMELSKKEVDNLIANEVSNVEVERRFDLAAAAVYSSDRETRDELQGMGVGLGDQMKYWMNPQAQLGELQQKYKMAEIGGAAVRSGFGKITHDQMRRLTEVGLDRDQAMTGFTELSRMGELFTGMDIGERDITEDEQISLLAGDNDVREMLEARQQRRLAEFAGSGGYVSGEEGFSTGQAR